MDTIKILVKEPYKAPYIKVIEHTLENMQAVVGGRIERIDLPGTKNIDVYLNEEGKLEHLPGNLWIAGTGDCIVGTCFMVGYNPKCGDIVSLSDKQIKKCENYIEKFALPENCNLYISYFSLIPTMLEKSEKYLRKSILEM